MFSMSKIFFGTLCWIEERQWLLPAVVVFGVVCFFFRFDVDRLSYGRSTTPKWSVVIFSAAGRMKAA